MGSYRNAEDVRAIARRLQDLQGDERAQAVTQATITGLFKVRGPSRVVLAPFHLLPSRKKEAAFLNLFRTLQERDPDLMNGIINQMADHVVNGRDQDPLSAGGLNGVEYGCLAAILDDVEGSRPRVELVGEPEDAGQEAPTPRGPGV